MQMLDQRTAKVTAYPYSPPDGTSYHAEEVEVNDATPTTLPTIADVKQVVVYNNNVDGGLGVAVFLGFVEDNDLVVPIEAGRSFEFPGPNPNVAEVQVSGGGGTGNIVVITYT